MNKPSGKCIVVQPGAYPVLPPAAAQAISRRLRDPSAAAAAETALQASAADIRDAVQVHIDRLQAHIGRMQAAIAAGDFARIYDEAHEVRGLAGNAGLTASAEIAAILCRYLDALVRADVTPEPAVVQLHLEAVVRAAQTEDEATRLGSTVARVLATLVDKKIAEINALETGSAV